jgi:putative MATE family efflux protein
MSSACSLTPAPCPLPPDPVSQPLPAATGTFRPMLRLATPVLIEQILHLAVEFTDMILTGNFLPGDAYVAAIALMAYVLWILGMMFGFVFYGSMALTARFTGKRDPVTTNHVMNQSIAIGLVWAAVLMLLGIPLADDFVRLMGLEGVAAAAATRYLTIELYVLPCIMIERVGISCLRGAGDTVSGLWVMVVVNIVNLGLSYTLVTGALGLPKLGWDGLAIGTATGHVVGSAILVALLATGRAGYRLRFRGMLPDGTMIRRILRIGIPGGIDGLLVCGSQLLFVRIITSLGETPFAAHGVALQIEAVAFMPAGAFQIAAATMAGQYLGAGDPKRATDSVLSACGAAIVFMVAAGVGFYIYAIPLATIFLGDPTREAVPLAADILHVIAYAMLPLALVNVLSGGLRGAGDTRWPLAITLMGMIAVRLPLALYIAKEEFTIPGFDWHIEGLGYGVVGAWYAVVADLIVRATLFVARFLHGGWKRIEV